LWFVNGLKDSERFTFRNEIVWQKNQAQGRMSDKHRQYPTGSERCLFFMIGEQGFSNNSDNYWEGFEPIRAYLQTERDKAGMTNKTVADIFGFHPRMADHWFSKSQWSFPQKEQYEAIQKAANGKAFNGEYGAFRREYDELKQEFNATRAYFDNTHDNMTDVWEYASVSGEERLGHATPKPVAMIERCIRSSSEENAIVIEPFLGSGTTLIAAENTNRKCYGMEISPKYCDVIIQRWENATGQKAVLDEG
jgi:DNA modification methylase